jgi:hypothetical protein
VECRRYLPLDARPNRRYCSSVCRQRGWRQRVKNALRRVREVPTCAHCGTPIPFEAELTGRRVRRDRKYCSDRCKQQHHQARRRAGDYAARAANRPST